MAQLERKGRAYSSRIYVLKKIEFLWLIIVDFTENKVFGSPPDVSELF